MTYSQHSNKDSTDSSTASTIWSEESFVDTSDTGTTPSASGPHLKYEVPTNFDVKLTTVFGKQKWSTRKKMIVFGVIPLSIIVSVVVIAILLAVLMSRSTENTPVSTTAANAHSNLDSSAAATIIEVGGGGASGGPPCSSYTMINDPSRNVASSGVGGTCDDRAPFDTSIGGAWIRFMGSGGTNIPLTSSGNNHCSAYLSGWYNGSLPSTVGSIENGYGCFETMFSLCTFHYKVSVVNCDAFNVYFLPPVLACNARYCTV